MSRCWLVEREKTKPGWGIVVVSLAENEVSCWDIWLRTKTVVAPESGDSCL
jgi:hypothetical protein